MMPTDDELQATPRRSSDDILVMHQQSFFGDSILTTNFDIKISITSTCTSTPVTFELYYLVSLYSQVSLKFSFQFVGIRVVPSLLIGRCCCVVLAIRTDSVFICMLSIVLLFSYCCFIFLFFYLLVGLGICFNY